MIWRRRNNPLPASPKIQRADFGGGETFSHQGSAQKIRWVFFFPDFLLKSKKRILGEEIVIPLRFCAEFSLEIFPSDFHLKSKKQILGEEIVNLLRFCAENLPEFFLSDRRLKSKMRILGEWKRIFPPEFSLKIQKADYEGGKNLFSSQIFAQNPISGFWGKKQSVRILPPPFSLLKMGEVQEGVFVFPGIIESCRN